MVLQGEAAHKRTYSGFQPLRGRDVVVARHAILGKNCVQKTYGIVGREDAVMFAEPRLLDDLEHPNITPLREAQFDPDRPGCVTLVMKVYEGGSILDQLNVGHRFSVSEALAIATQVAEALVYLHADKRYVHRDMKPGNVLLSGDLETAYLSDFGSAAQLGEEGTAAAVRTTALYQPPEGARTGRVGPAADIFGLGMTVMEALNGPLDYASLDAAAIDQRVNNGQRSLPDRMFAAAAFAPHVPTTVIRLVREMVDPDPARRPSAAVLLRRIRQLRVIDWRLTDRREGLDRVWSGWWPPRLRRERQIELQVRATMLRAGRVKGQLRLTAVYRTATSGGWRTVGVDPATCMPHDSAAVSAFFKAVDAEVARRWPA